MKKILLIIILFSMSACATEQGYVNILNTWVGATEAELIEQQGPPHRSYEVDEKNT